MEEDKIIEDLASQILEDTQENVEPVVTQAVDPVTNTATPNVTNTAVPNVAPATDVLLQQLNDNITGLRDSMKPKPTKEELDAQNSINSIKQTLGFDSLAQSDQLEQLKAQINELQGREYFKDEWRKLEREFAGITKEELGAFAKKEGLEGALNNPAAWRAIVKMMKAEADPIPNKEQIVKGGGGEAKKDDPIKRMKNGETVSDIEIGEYLLNGG
jgi:hypothetical protein